MRNRENARQRENRLALRSHRNCNCSFLLFLYKLSVFNLLIRQVLFGIYPFYTSINKYFYILN